MSTKERRFDHVRFARLMNTLDGVGIRQIQVANMVWTHRKHDPQLGREISYLKSGAPRAQTQFLPQIVAAVNQLVRGLPVDAAKQALELGDRLEIYPDDLRLKGPGPSADEQLVAALDGCSKLWDADSHEFESFVSRAEGVVHLLPDVLSDRGLRGSPKDPSLAERHQARVGKALTVLLDATFATSPLKRPPLKKHRLSIAKSALSILAPLEFSEDAQLEAEALLGLSQVYHSMEGDAWNPVAWPVLDRLETERVLHCLSRAEQASSRLAQLGAQHRSFAVRQAHVQVLCRARTMAQGRLFDEAHREIERARSMLGCVEPVSNVIESIVHGLSGDADSQIASLERAEVAYSNGQSPQLRELGMSCRIGLDLLCGDSRLEESMGMISGKAGLIAKSSYFVNFAEARRRIR